MEMAGEKPPISARNSLRLNVKLYYFDRCWQLLRRTKILAFNNFREIQVTTFEILAATFRICDNFSATFGIPVGNLPAFYEHNGEMPIKGEGGSWVILCPLSPHWLSWKLEEGGLYFAIVSLATEPDILGTYFAMFSCLFYKNLWTVNFFLSFLFLLGQQSTTFIC